VTPQRIVSLVPSLTDLVALLGAGDRLVGVTDYCVRGAPEGAVRVGGSKYFDPDAVVALLPDVVLANTEENHPDGLAALRDAGLAVVETFPRTVDDVPGLLLEVAHAVGADAAPLVAELDAALDEADRNRPTTPVAALTLIWRKPWMAVGPDTYVDDLLHRCGFANVLAGFAERYPRLDVALELGPEVVLLPSEPYAFDEGDADAVRELVGDVPQHFVDGELLTWHGPRTAEALRRFTTLARTLLGARHGASTSSNG
jgi:ABC-type hemin transport system substrate-binding protein